MQKFQGNASFARADKLIRINDFQSALKENEKALVEEHMMNQMDMKIFQRGLIYGHPRNPDRNPEKSKAEFERLIEAYPDSSLVEPAKALILCWEQIEIMQNEIAQNECSDLNGEIGRLEHALTKRKNSVAGCQEKLNHQQADIQRLKDQIAILEAQIEEYKTIDLHIEEKKQR